MNLPRKISAVSALAAIAAVGFAASAVTTQVCAEGPSAQSCAKDCYAGHNQCRISTKGSPSCDGKLTSCLSRCK